ncbi:hypothetical protein [Aestuariivirga sp.]|uniref:hypothetical protein n=1 Tax=Aestuariivirga sp. TaxID=2650926 RepID=UPI00391DC3FB
MPLRPVKWLLYTPVAVLPFLAALLHQGKAGEAEEGLPVFAELLLLFGHHWAWMLVALGLGVWVGWYTATDRPSAEEEAGA